jgi:hypothetical protein
MHIYEHIQKKYSYQIIINRSEQWSDETPYDQPVVLTEMVMVKC